MEMKDAVPVTLQIDGTQSVEGESDTVTVFTTGLLSQDGERVCLKYSETTEDGSERTTIIIANGNKTVSMQRVTGDKASLIIENGVRHSGYLSFSFGDISLNILGKEIVNNLSVENGGELFMKYDLELGGRVSSSHSLHIKLKLENRKEQ